MASKWFDYNNYMASKLAQVQKADPAANWTMTTFVKAFADAGFAGADGAEKHFTEYGQYEDLSPNAFFNATEYYRAKAADFYEYTDPKKVTDLDVANVKLALANAKMSAWEHYKMYGTAEGVNPSNSFNSDAYLDAKLKLLNGTEGKMTLPELKAEFQKMGLSALEHFLTYGGGTGEPAGLTADGKIPDAYVVPDNQKVSPAGGGSNGSTLTLTKEVDNIVGTALDDVIIGDFDTTMQAADQINGGDGIDTLKTYGAYNAAKMPASITSVEKFEMHSVGATSIDLSAYKGVQSVLVDGLSVGAANKSVKVASGASVELQNIVGGASALSISTPDEVLNLSITDLIDDTLAFNLNVAGSGTKTLSLTATGENEIVLSNAGGKLDTLVVGGNGEVSISGTVATITTVNASANKGGVVYDADDNLLKFTGGTGNDTLAFAAGTHITAGAAIDMGDGLGDTLVLGALSTLTAGQITAVNKIKGLDILSLGSAGATGYSLDASEFDTFQSFQFTKGAIGTAGTSGGSARDGDAGISIENISAKGNGLIILGEIDAAAMTFVGGTGAGGATAGNGGAGMEITAYKPGSTSTITVEIASDVALTGGKGDTGTVKGIAGVGLDAEDFNALNFVLNGDLTIAAGAANSGTASVMDTLVAKNTTITLTGKGDADLGIVANRVADIDAAGSMIINAEKLDGELTVTTGGGDDTITAGSKGSTIDAGKGADTLTAGAGKDVFLFAAGDSGTVTGSGATEKLAEYDVINGFKAGANGDVLDIAAGGDAKAYDELTTSQLSDVKGMKSLLAAATKAVEFADVSTSWTAFTWGDKTYAVYNDDASYDDATSVIIELAGVTVTDLTDGNFA